MRHILSILLLFLTTLPSFAQHAIVVDTLRADSAERALVRRVCRVVQQNERLLETTQMGLSVYDLTAQRPLITCGEKQRLRPASNEKILTAIAALTLLGTDYHYETQVLTDGEITAHGKLEGNLYIRAGYDALLSKDDLRQWVQALAAKGVTHIKGGLIFDLSMKDDTPWGRGWCWDDKEKPLTPLPFDNATCSDAERTIVDGRSISAPAFDAALREVLAEASIKVHDTTALAPVPQTASLLFTTRRHIDQALLPMMKDSDNNVAESLFYQLSATSSPATAKRSARRILALADSLGLNTQQMEIADGSGLSLYNYASPHIFVRFLRHAYAQSAIFRHLLPALPIAGVDGTLRRRMCGTKAEGNVRAKTGTVTGVSTLAGYCTAANGHTLCFSIMNSGLTKAAVGRNFQDKVCVALTE